MGRFLKPVSWNRSLPLRFVCFPNGFISIDKLTLKLFFDRLLLQQNRFVLVKFFVVFPFTFLGKSAFLKNDESIKQCWSKEC
jgi:hypothetical protein